MWEHPIQNFWVEMKLMDFTVQAFYQLDVGLLDRFAEFLGSVFGSQMLSKHAIDTVYMFLMC